MDCNVRHSSQSRHPTDIADVTFNKDFPAENQKMNISICQEMNLLAPNGLTLAAHKTRNLEKL